LTLTKSQIIIQGDHRKEGPGEKESSCKNQGNQGKKSGGEKEGDKEKEMTACSLMRQTKLYTL